MLQVLSNVIAFIRIILLKIGPFARNYVIPAIEAMTIIRDLLKREEFDLLADLTNPEWDNEFLEKLRNAIAKAIMLLGVFNVNSADKGDPIKIIEAFIKYLQTEPDTIQEGILHRLSGLVAIQLSGRENIKLSEIDAITQLAYLNKKNKEHNA